METDGTHLFARRIGGLINVSRHGQLAIKDMIAARLERIERDNAGLAKRCTRSHENT